ncbi:MAG: MarR family transcriptional regulator [Actinomycetota bacterium]|nr:MarR family transcriptional regulator [Actinomycetota bacterium]
MTVWLDDREFDAWVTMLRASVLLLQRLDEELQEAHGLSLSDYEVLVQLSAAPDGALRMSDLAERALVSKSRLTHAVDRLQQAGLVDRQRCETDRRGYFAVLTDLGRRRLEEAAPTHVAGVRRHLLAQGEPADLDHVTRFLARVAESLTAER